MAPRPRKRFAQHWLKSESALQQIVKAASLSGSASSPAPTPPHPPANTTEPAAASASVVQTGDRVLEIGPGTGILTRRLLAEAAAVVSVEIDRDLCAILHKTFQQADNFLLLQGDFLELDVDALLEPFPKFQQPNKVVANIPYNITGEILEKLLGRIAQPNPQPFDSIVLLIQKEVAQRLCAKPGSKEFGALTVRVQYLAECDWICAVPAKAFHPAPKVDSAVVRLRPRAFVPAAHQPKFLDQLVKLGFATRRKMLRNNLQAVVDRDRLSNMLEQLQLNPQARAEELGVADWVALSNALQQVATPVLESEAIAE
ncbi:16S rRNA (adenine(1518)-N(6)/adenine(1519)-N(6))-dimethyltransferase RsmA [Leptolyngbya sp. AN02str]|uniref:16S rRNA (adenine(1518)-N(6)/adenine(1519)-N(6))- dimethyltransferase RsmA n=1 Tax=Leptolyngbya sp. AN02str TaxID=3423363 RepID=UPI003D31ABB5